MSIPAKNFVLMHAIASLIFKRGPMQEQQLIESLNAQASPYACRRAVLRMVEKGTLQGDGVAGDEGALWRLSEEMEAHYADLAVARSTKPQPAGPRYLPAFRPLSEKYIPTSAGTRPGCEAREFHPVSAGYVNTPYVWGEV